MTKKYTIIIDGSDEYQIVKEFGKGIHSATWIKDIGNSLYSNNAKESVKIIDGGKTIFYKSVKLKSEKVL